MGVVVELVKAMIRAFPAAEQEMLQPIYIAICVLIVWGTRLYAGIQTLCVGLVSGISVDRTSESRPGSIVSAWNSVRYATEADLLIWSGCSLSCLCL